MTIKMNGTDDIRDEFDKLQQRAEQLEEKDEVSFGELFPDEFMREHTDCETLETFIEASPWTIESEQDFDEIPAEQFDDYVNQHTEFPNWEEMLGTAGEEYVARQLGF